MMHAAIAHIQLAPFSWAGVWKIGQPMALENPSILMAHRRPESEGDVF